MQLRCCRKFEFLLLEQPQLAKNMLSDEMKKEYLLPLVFVTEIANAFGTEQLDEL